MHNSGSRLLSRREWLGGALIATAGLLVMPRFAFAQTAVPTPDPADAAVRRLVQKATANALAQLSQPEGYWTSLVARIPMPTLFAAPSARKGALATDSFRIELHHRLNQLAAGGAKAAALWLPTVIDSVPLTASSAILRGANPTAATSAVRIEVGANLINAIIPGIEDAIRTAQDPIVAQAIASLTGVTEHDVAVAVATEADSATWFQIGADEVAIRQSKDAGGDPVLAAALGKS